MLLDYGAQKSVAKQVKTAAKRKEQQLENVVERKIARNTLTTIEGLSFVVTGDLETFETRKELKDFIERNGGKLNSTISAKVDYLIANDSKSDSKKYAKATSLGIEIITEYQFNDMANRRFLISEERSLIKYTGSDSAVVIPDGVTKISPRLFNQNKNIVSVIVPEGVKEIGFRTFAFCENLKEVIKSSDKIISGIPLTRDKVTVDSDIEFASQDGVKVRVRFVDLFDIQNSIDLIKNEFIPVTES